MIKKICLACIFIIGLMGCAYYYTEEIVPAEAIRFVQTAELREPTPQETEEFPQLTNLPTLYITFEYLPNIRDLTRAYHWLPATYTFIKGAEGGIFNEPLTIKRRGAWSYSHPKRPYSIELAREISWGGLPAANRWVLTANWSDKSLLRNHITFQLLRRVSEDWSPDTFFADVVINGIYEGTYLITEAIGIHKNRLDLCVATEAIFEINAIFRCKSSRGCLECIPAVDGHHHIIYRRPGGILCSRQRARNNEFFVEFFAEMQASLSEGYEAYSQFIDVPSFVNWYIIHELTKNFDSAFTASVFAFFKDGMLHMGPGWDFDTIFGNQYIGPPVNKTDPEGFWISSSPWFSRLMADEIFNRLVRERWTELRHEGVFCDFFFGLIDASAVHIAESAKLNFEIWTCALEFTMRSRSHGSTRTHEAEIEYIREWVSARIAWLDTQWYVE